MENGGNLTAYPGNLTFGNSEPSWSFFQQPQ